MEEEERRILGRLGEALRRPSMLWGYLAIAAIGALSTIGIDIYYRIFELSNAGGGRYPFVIFAMSIMFTILVARPIWLVIKLHPEPIRQLERDFLTYRVWLMTCIIVALALPQSLQFASVMKQTIPQMMPFYADRAIADMEEALLGAAAWEMTHAFIGETITRFLDVLYGSWHIVNIGLLTWLVLTPQKRFQVRGVLTYQLTWILLGGVLATLLASVGPCFLEVFTGDDRFAPLMSRLETWNADQPLHSFTAMGYLLRSKGTDAVGAGISAMPSLHVAVAFLTLLVVRNRTKNWIPRLLAAAYFLLILVGSVHLGWHYLLDGLISIPLVALLWWTAGKWVDRLAKPSAPSPASKLAH